MAPSAEDPVARRQAALRATRERGIQQGLAMFCVNSAKFLPSLLLFEEFLRALTIIDLT
jgi:hypothetical protein